MIGRFWASFIYAARPFALLQGVNPSVTYIPDDLQHLGKKPHCLSLITSAYLYPCELTALIASVYVFDDLYESTASQVLFYYAFANFDICFQDATVCTIFVDIDILRPILLKGSIVCFYVDIACKSGTIFLEFTYVEVCITNGTTFKDFVGTQMKNQFHCRTVSFVIFTVGRGPMISQPLYSF